MISGLLSVLEMAQFGAAFHVLQISLDRQAIGLIV
jgi:hypothetical protein